MAFGLSVLGWGRGGQRAASVRERKAADVQPWRRCDVVCELKLKGIEKPMVATGFLADLVGELVVLPRSGYMKLISDYAKKNSLKEKGNVIRCDAKLRKIFDGKEQITLFGANKYFGRYLLDPMDVGPEAIKRAEAYEKEYFERKGKEKPEKKTTPKKKPVKKRDAPNSALMRPVGVSPELAAICGATQLPRPHITKAIWAYAKANNLQSGRTIMCDDKLKKVMGQDKVDGFRMVKLLQPHIRK